MYLNINAGNLVEFIQRNRLSNNWHRHSQRSLLRLLVRSAIPGHWLLMLNRCRCCCHWNRCSRQRSHKTLALLRIIWRLLHSISGGLLRHLLWISSGITWLLLLWWIISVSLGCLGLLLLGTERLRRRHSHPTNKCGLRLLGLTLAWLRRRHLLLVLLRWYLLIIIIVHSSRNQANLMVCSRPEKTIITRLATKAATPLPRLRNKYPRTIFK